MDRIAVLMSWRLAKSTRKVHGVEAESRRVCKKSRALVDQTVSFLSTNTLLLPLSTSQSPGLSSKGKFSLNSLESGQTLFCIKIKYKSFDALPTFQTGRERGEKGRRVGQLRCFKACSRCLLRQDEVDRPTYEVVAYCRFVFRLRLKNRKRGGRQEKASPGIA